MALIRQGGGGYYFVYCFFAGTSKGELHHQKPFLEYCEPMNTFECLICYNFSSKHPSKLLFVQHIVLFAHLFVCI